MINVVLIANFTLNTAQLQVLAAFRNQPDTRSSDRHPMFDVDHTVTQLRRLTREGYLLWHDGDREAKRPPGYTLTPKGEMILRIVEEELRRTLEWFGGSTPPVSMISGGASAVATGKAELSRKGVAVAKRKRSA